MKKKIIIISVSVLVAAGIIVFVCLKLFGGNYIGRAAAQEAAINKIGVDASEIKHIEAEFEEDHGLRYYEVSVIVGTTEYEYAVDAETGEILSEKSESVFD